MIGFILFGIPAAIIAAIKGFAPFRWLLALGLIGFIAVISLPSAKSKSISPEQAESRINDANKLGGWMAVINIILGVVVLIIRLL
jgi:hypothetical protein